MEQEEACEGFSLSLLMDDRSKSPFLLASEGDLIQLKAAKLSLLDTTDPEGCTLLHHASRNGHLPVMHHLIDSGISLDAADRSGNTALHLAVTSGQIEAMELLLARGASDAVLNGDQEAPLHVAVRNGNLCLLRAFLDHPEVNLFPGDGNQTILHMLVESDLIEPARVILDSKPFEEMVHKMAATDANCTLLRRTNKDGLTALHLAARKNSHQTLDLLLKACQTFGLSVEQVLNSHNEDMFTPMHAAVNAGSGEVVDVLLHHGASPLTVKGKELPPLHIACFLGRLGIVKSMVEHSGEDILNHRDDSGGTPLHYAVSARGCGVVSYILRTRSVDIDIADKLGRTPLHAAVLLKNLSCIKQLVDGKADLFCKDNQHQNVLHFAVMKYQQGILRYLMLLPEVSGLMSEADRTGDTPFHLTVKCNTDDLCAQVLEQSMVKEIQDGNGNCYIHLVSAVGNKTMLKRVLEVPSYLNALNEENTFGETPLHLAAKAGHEECMELLLDHGASPRWSHMDRTAFFQACSNGHVACARILLDRFPFQKNWIDSRGNTALHFAVLSPCPGMVRFLLDSEINISLNRDSKSFLEAAMERGYVDSVKAALHHSKWQECLDCNAPDRPHIMLQFIRSMPEAAKVVLDRSFESATVDKLHPGYWEKFSFKYLQLQPSKRDSFRATMDIIEFGKQDLINHPVVNTLIKLKWNKYGFWVYLFFFTLRLILAILVSVFAVLVFNPGRQLTPGGENLTDVTQPNGTVHSEIMLSAQIIRVAALLLNLVLSVHLTFPILSEGFYIFNFIANASLWIFAFTMISNFVFLLTPNPLSFSSAAALACFFSWMMVLIALGFFDIFGIYVRMFLRITRSVFQVSFLGLVLILAFSFPFYLLVDTLPSFSILQYTLVTTFFYMLGDFQQDPLISMDIEGQLGNGGLVFLFLIVAVILLSIVMANLLIGLAVGDIEKIKKDASIEKKAVLAKYLCHIDKIPIFKRYHLQTYVRHPNAKVTVVRQLWRYFWRAAKEDAVSKEERHDSQGSGDRMSEEDKLDSIVDRLDKLTTIVQLLKEQHSSSS